MKIKELRMIAVVQLLFLALIAKTMKEVAIQIEH